MHNKSAPLLLTLAVSLLTACITVSTPTQESAGTPLFITSTLAPTKQLAALPSRTPTDRGGTPTPAITAPPNCKEQAVLLEDVTVPDNTKMEAGESFTKTWKLKNTGTCPWAGYTLAFADGDRMGAPDSTPVPQTVSGAEVDISVELIAPQTDGAYTGNFSLRNAEEEIVKIGLEDSMWVKILVGDGTISPTANPNGTPVSNGSSDIGNCNYELNAGYASQILSLINSARAEAGVSTLSVNAQLTAAARAHSADMGCHNMTGHTGSNGSTLQARIAAQGYRASYSEEIVYAGGGAQAAFQWWMNDAIHRKAILNPKSVDAGIGYASVDGSTYGDYFTVDFASP